jgi:serine/threonine-protein kinase
MDFGIAKRKGGETLTATGHIVGTPEYMSPEQAQGHRVDFRSDIYALGIVIYEIFTGKVPFRGETPISTILKHINEPPPLEGPQAMGIPDALRPVLRRCLAKESKDRYASATELAEALRNARSPSRRQVPMPTEVLHAPTAPAAPAVRSPRPAVQPWLLAVPLVVVVAGVVVLKGQLGAMRPAAAPSPMAVEAAPTPAATVAAASAPGAASTPPIEVASAGNEPATKAFGDTLAKAAAAPPPSPAGFGIAARPLRPSPRPVSAPSPVTATRPATPAPTPVPAPPTTAAALPAVAEGPGLLQVAVKPWGEVAVDGRVVGTTPIDRITLPAGAHTVRVRHPLYEPWERTVTIRAGQLERVLVDLPAMGVRKPD